jgi:uncharacterized phage protein gp47/JayE
MILPTLGPTITSAGISAPSYSSILASLIASAQQIFGSDAYLSSDSQDGQLLALIASAINDSNNACIAVYNSFSPVTAQGTALSSLVKINGIRRLSSSASSAVGTVVGVAGTTITNGEVADINGNVWDLPPSVTIPGGGSISVTVTAEVQGVLVAPAGTINKINTPTFGWQSFVSTSDAIPGTAVETDAALRARQAISAALPAITPLGALTAALANLAGVTDVKVYENATGSVDSNGNAPHSIAAVVGGGALQSIVNTIGAKKTPGAAMNGTTSGTYTDPLTGISYTISYYALALTPVSINMTVKAGNGYSSAVTTEIQNALSAYIGGLAIGAPVQYSRLFAAAYLNGLADGSTYEITVLQSSLPPGAFGTVDLAIPFNSAAVCPPASVTVVVT